MIQQINPNNFRGIKKLSLSNLKKLTLIVGENNSGKSSVIESLLLVSAIEYDLNLKKVMLEIAQSRGYKKMNEEFFKSTFIDFNLKRSSEICYGHKDVMDKKLAIHPLNIKNIWEIFDQLRGTKENNIEDFKLAVERRISKNRFGLIFHWEDYTKKTNKIYYIDEEYYLRSTEDKNKKEYEQVNERNSTFYHYPQIEASEMVGQISTLIRKKKMKEIIDFLQEIEPKLDDITILEGNTIFCDIGLENDMIPINMMGEGFKKIVEILSSLYLTKSKILLIDEIENGLYYKSQKMILKQLLKLSQNFGVQILMTSHSYETAEALYTTTKETKLFDNVEIIRIDRNDDRHQVVNYDYEKMSSVFEMNIEFR